MKYTTLCYIEKDNKYLMLHRIKRSVDVNKDKWIGVGGHFQEGETPEECLKREVLEETGLTLTKYKLCGKLHFHMDDLFEICYLYKANDFKGNLLECDEGRLEWIPINEIFNLNLWEGDYLFLEKMLKDDPYFEMELVYKGNKLQHYEVLK